MSESTPNLDDLRSYYDRLANHDWYYEHANGRTYTLGLAVHQALKKEAREDPAKSELFNQYSKYMYGKGTDESVKPQRP